MLVQQLTVGTLLKMKVALGEITKGSSRGEEESNRALDQQLMTLDDEKKQLKAEHEVVKVTFCDSYFTFLFLKALPIIPNHAWPDLFKHFNLNITYKNNGNRYKQI